MWWVRSHLGHFTFLCKLCHIHVAPLAMCCGFVFVSVTEHCPKARYGKKKICNSRWLTLHHWGKSRQGFKVRTWKQVCLVFYVGSPLTQELSSQWNKTCAREPWRRMLSCVAGRQVNAQPVSSYSWRPLSLDGAAHSGLGPPALVSSMGFYYCDEYYHQK